MPRMPKQPCDCDCHAPVSASEDVKLKLLEKKLKEELLSPDELKTLNGESLVGSENIEINGIVSVTENTKSGVSTITIKTDNNKEFKFTVKQGAPGPKGEKGDKGDKGDPGKEQIVFSYSEEFPVVGEPGFLYIAKNEHNAYIWDNEKMVYFPISVRQDMISGGDADSFKN